MNSVKVGYSYRLRDKRVNNFYSFPFNDLSEVDKEVQTVFNEAHQAFDKPGFIFELKLTKGE
jgi:hypothetical protein